MELMATPRCGVSDNKRSEESRVRLGQSGAYVLQGSRWQVKQLSYRSVTQILCYNATDINNKNRILGFLSIPLLAV